MEQCGSQDSQELLKGGAIRHGRHALILLTYKHPLRKKEGSRSEPTFYAEAVVLPGTLHIGEPSSSSVEHLVEGFVCLGSIGCLAYLSLDFNKLDIMSTGPSPRKVLLEFTSNCLAYHQLLQVGHCYMQLNQDDRSLTACKVVNISQCNPLRGLCLLSSGVSRCELRQTDSSSLYRRFLVKDTSSETCPGVKFVPYGAPYGEDTMGSFITSVSELKTRLTPSVRRVCDVLNVKLSVQGSLVSFCGLVVTKTSTSSSTCKLQVKDFHGPEVVGVTLDGTKVVFPSSLKPGTIASFYRVLMRSFVLETIATTLVVVHGVYNRTPSPEFHSSLTAVTPCHIARLNGSLRLTGLSLHCRVVATAKLVFKWHLSSNKEQSHLSSVSVLSGCFVVDDGTGLAECWVYDTSQIWTLLGLSCRRKQGESAKRLQRTTQRFCSVIQKHTHVVYENQCSEDMHTSKVLQGDDNRTLSETDQTVVETFLRRNCHPAPVLLVCDSLLNDENYPVSQPKVKLLVKFAERISYSREAERLSQDLASKLNIKGKESNNY